MSLSTNLRILIIIFRSDSREELELVRESSLEFGALDSVICDHWAKGGLGAIDLAKSIVKYTETPVQENKWIYELTDSLTEKITKLAKSVYCFKGEIEFSEEAKTKLDSLEKNVFLINF